MQEKEEWTPENKWSLSATSISDDAPRTIHKLEESPIS
jgi:hypothetical protein